MRARNIKPGLYANEDLAECSFEARWLFPGLWMIADCYGRLENRPKGIGMKIFPGDAVEVAPLLSELEGHGLVRIYDDGKHIWIPTFTKHQTPHVKERAKGSSLPRHEDDRNYWKEAPDSPESRDESGDGPRLVLDESGTGPGSSLLIPDCGYLIPDSGCPDVLNPESGETAQGPKRADDDENPSSDDIPSKNTNTRHEQIMGTWNILAKEHDLALIRSLTPKRRSLINTRSRDPDWLSEWEEAMTKIPDSQFLLGKKPDTDWKADFDWFLKPDTTTKLLEGKYNDNENRRQEIGITDPDNNGPF